MMKNLVSSSSLVEIYHWGGGGVDNRNSSAPPWLVGLVEVQGRGYCVQLEPFLVVSQGYSQRVGWTLFN